MSVALAAIIISVFSVTVAATSLGWNIYRDIILKPKGKTTVSVVTVFGQGAQDSLAGEPPQFIRLQTTNFGPGPMLLQTIVLRQVSLWRRIRRSIRNAVLIHDPLPGYGSTLPARLEVGEESTILLPYNKDSFLAGEWNRVGVDDTFGRIHWANDRGLREAREQWRKDFAKVSASAE